MKGHKRVNDILLGPLERPALQWLSAHMPAWMNPDILTAIGVVGAFLTGLSYALTWKSDLWLWLASFGLVVNWYGDSLDGTLARYRKIERPRYGFFVDHTLDALSQMMIILGMGISPYMRFDVAALLVISYLMLEVEVLAHTYVRGSFRISYGKLGPTELRLILILLNSLVFFAGNPSINSPLGVLTMLDIIVAAFAITIFLLFILNTVWASIEMRDIDRKPE